MNFKKFLLFGIMAAVCSVESVLAQEIKVDIDVNSTAITVSGALGGGMAEKRLMMYCMQKGTGLSDLQAESETPVVTNAFAGIGYTTSNASGDYTFADFMINGSSGEYNFYVVEAATGTSYAQESVYVTAKTDVDGFIGAMTSANGITNEDDRIAAVVSVLDTEASSSTIGIKMPVYKLLDGNTRKKVAENLGGKTFTNVTGTQDFINIASVRPCIEAAASGEGFDMVMFPEDYPELKDIAAQIKTENPINSFESDPAFGILSSFNKADRIAVLNKALQIANGNSVVDKITVTVINKQLAECSGYGDITGIIEAHKDNGLVSLDFSAYNNSKYRNDLNKDLAAKSFNSCTELVQYIQTYLSSALAAENNSAGGNVVGGGGNGGGGGGGSAYFKPSEQVVTPEHEDNKPEIPENPVLPEFSDMEGYDWAREAVESLYAKGIISGRSEDVFAPQENVKREEFTKMIVNAFKLYDPYAWCDFSDVEKGSWYESYVASGVKNNIIYGISEDKFGTGLFITRQDMAVVTARAMGGVPENTGADFTDSDKVADYAKQAVAYMKEKGIVSGYPDGSFGPEKLCTRAEAAVIIYTALRNR